MTDINEPNENPDRETIFITDKDTPEKPREFINTNVVMSVTGMTCFGDVNPHN